MNEIIIRAQSSYLAKNSMLALFKSGDFNALYARFQYCISKGLPPLDKPENYPLMLEGYLAKEPTRIYVTSLTAGYNGTGPNALVAILKAAGFTFDENDILTGRNVKAEYPKSRKEEWIRLTFRK